MDDILDHTSARVRGLDLDELLELFHRYEASRRFRCPRCLKRLLVTEHPLSPDHADWSVSCLDRDCLVEAVAVLRRPARSQPA